jgi:hypothetical protein
MAKSALADAFNEQIATGDLGTQLFWLNRASDSKQLEYALPVQAGADFGGDTETFDAVESDLDYVPKITGRASLDDVSYTSNFTKERYARWQSITNEKTPQTYVEVLSNGSAMVISATAGNPRIMSGDVRTIQATLAPQAEVFVADIENLTEDEIAKIQPYFKDEAGTNIDLTNGLPFDFNSIPTGRLGEAQNLATA